MANDSTNTRRTGESDAKAGVKRKTVKAKDGRRVVVDCAMTREEWEATR